MLDDLHDQAFAALSDMVHLHLEATQLFDQGLASGDVSDLIEFIEHQVAQDPPQLFFLRDLADDLQRRLESLRVHYVDMREQVVRLLQEEYAIDITPLTPAEAASDYHRLKPAEILAFVESLEAQADLPLLSRTVEIALWQAARLQRDISLAAMVCGLLDDWLRGISAIAARQYGHFIPGPALFSDLPH